MVVGYKPPGVGIISVVDSVVTVVDTSSWVVVFGEVTCVGVDATLVVDSAK